MLLLMSLFSCLLVAYGFYYMTFMNTNWCHTASKKAILWGKKFAPIPKIEKLRIRGNISMLVVALGWVLFFAFKLMDSYPYEIPDSMYIVFLACNVVTPIVCLIAVKPAKRVLKIIEKSNNALELGDLEILTVVDEMISEANAVELTADRICLLDQTGYIFFEVTYAQYHLGNLNDKDELIMLSYYFSQKYAGQFSCEVVANLNAHILSEISFKRI